MQTMGSSERPILTSPLWDYLPVPMQAALHKRYQVTPPPMPPPRANKPKPTAGYSDAADIPQIMNKIPGFDRPSKAEEREAV